MLLPLSVMRPPEFNTGIQIGLWTRNYLCAIFDQLTPAGDTLLHEAAYFGTQDIAELIGHHFPHILTKTNIQGDTPLHVAARSKSWDVVNLILSQSCMQNKEEGIVTRLSNEYGNTALHEAVFSKNLDGITLLFQADQCVAHCLNKSGQSPLYLAVLTKDKEIVDILLEAPFPEDKPPPNCHGNSPLHAAIYTRNAVLLKEMVAKKTELMYLRDEDGGTPLHYAAATGYVEGVGILLKKSTLTALEWNTKGQLPIHLASRWGHVEVVKELLHQEWPNSRVLLNKKGQNILHIAVKKAQENVVKYVLNMKKQQLINFNEKDKNGNTALHLASEKVIPTILFCLTRDRRIDVNILNNEGLTAGDILMLKCETPMTLKPLGQCLSYLILHSVGAPLSNKGRRLLSMRGVEPKVDLIRDRVNTLMLVAMLIATVTFAAVFTVPGGVYSSDDPNPHKRGMPVLANRSMFKTFVLFDTVAMCSSIFGSFTLFWAKVGDYHVAIRSYFASLYMVYTALVMMTLAFVAAVHLVVSNIWWLANLVTLIGILFISLILGFGVLEVFPYGTLMPLLGPVRELLIRALYRELDIAITISLTVGNMITLALLPMCVAFMAAVSLVVTNIPCLSILITLIGIFFFNFPTSFLVPFWSYTFNYHDPVFTCLYCVNSTISSLGFPSHSMVIK
ncbi:protein ACCELERATED CELL DEATH 6-like [Senna tora]|uniref:Protein ACCELERATED CELL DEATH 6-like n=1 Tax=Senna tora TaxID=362788 RepID=A0A834X335_9FABA|nr:protein ACCELERATED CELL DEATH 6-like [Senna tora]